MKYVIIYYLIGVCVSSYFIWHYRYSKKRGFPKSTDSIGGLIGPWVWPFQIIFHIQLIFLLFIIKK